MSFVQTATKPYHRIPILECEEPLITLPAKLFVLQTPHPYASLAAPYGERSPYSARLSVLEGLILAQSHLQDWRPGWRIQIFDAYRPIAVQQFMVDHTFAEVAQTKGVPISNLSEMEKHAIWQEVYQFWAIPSHNPATPPPHSTGGAIDITLVDEQDQPVDMGSPIDELSPRSYPNYYAIDNLKTLSWLGDGIDLEQAREFHDRRQLLRQIMLRAGFCQHPNEWWHFSMGDQLWAWTTNQNNPTTSVSASYGAIE